MDRSAKTMDKRMKKQEDLFAEKLDALANAVYSNQGASSAQTPYDNPHKKKGKGGKKGKGKGKGKKQNWWGGGKNNHTWDHTQKIGSWGGHQSNKGGKKGGGKW